MSYDLLDFITEDGPNYFKRIGKGPLNNQNLRIQLVKIKSYKPLLIIETGTFLVILQNFCPNFQMLSQLKKSRLFYYLSKSRFHNEKSDSNYLRKVGS